MKLKAGIVFGAIVVVWQLIFGFAGMYKNPALGWVFPVIAIVITAGVLYWALKQTASEGKGYWGLVGTGMVIALIACVLIIAVSLLYTSVLFPDYAELGLAQAAEQIEASGLPQEQQEAQMKFAEWLASPVPQAVAGAVMTLITSFVVSLVVAAIVKKKN
jgi:hypothetical protein